MARWANEDRYDAEVSRALAAAGIASRYAPVVKAIIGVESGFSASAIRQEPSHRCPLTNTIGDASRGLMQILYCTALDIGYNGAPSGLFDPATNITLGVRYFRDRMVAHGGDTWAAVSAYNNGHGRTATTAQQICLARGAGNVCQQFFNAQPGQFLNQPYVDKVMAAAEYFGYPIVQQLPPVVVIGTPDPKLSPWVVAGAVFVGVVLLDQVTS